MERQTLAAILVAALIVLAGCSGGTPDGAATDGIDSADAPSATPDGSSRTAGGSDSTRTHAGGSGSVRFYVSDERNAIGDFRYLNVTVSKIGLKSAQTAENESAATATATPTSTETPTPDGSNSSASLAAGDATATSTAAMDAAGGPENGGWIEYDVDSRTYDLTELQGANASHLADVTVPEGEYEKVFVYVSSVEGTLDDGTTVNVKLPSEKLHLNKGFAVGDGESVDFVYDITVHRAGKSGKYVLKPVVGQSGTTDEVDIEPVDDGDDTGGAADDSNALSASFVGDVSPGDDAIVEATVNGTALANATVEVDGEVIGETDDRGRVTVSIPEGAEEFEVSVTHGDEAVELARQFESEGDSSAKGNGNEKRGGGNGKDGGKN